MLHSVWLLIYFYNSFRKICYILTKTLSIIIYNHYNVISYTYFFFVLKREERKIYKIILIFFTFFLKLNILLGMIVRKIYNTIHIKKIFVTCVLTPFCVGYNFNICIQKHFNKIYIS